MAKASTLRTLSDDQLFDELDSAKKELFNLRFAFATGQLDNSAQMAATKRDIARMHTVLREREIAAADAQAVEGQAGTSSGSSAGLAGVSQGSVDESAGSSGDMAQHSAAGPVGVSASAAAQSPAATGDRS